MKNPRDITPRQQAEIEAGADTLLYPGKGGIAVWVRRDEHLPRAAMRFRGEDVPLAEGVTMIAVLQVAQDALLENMARLHGVPVEEFRAMVGTAHNFMRDHVGTVTKDRQVPRRA